MEGYNRSPRPVEAGSELDGAVILTFRRGRPPAVSVFAARSTELARYRAIGAWIGRVVRGLRVAA
jgi:hypothetical protein